MNKTDLVKVANRDSGRVGYKIDELGVMRQFAPRETKEVTFEELERLSFLPGGDVMLKNYLIVKNPEAIKQLGIDVEPEYYYTEKEIKDILVNGTMDQFLDCLDFAPDGVLDLLKKMAVDLPLNDMQKRDAIFNKLGFNVSKAIEIKNTKYDGDTEREEETSRAPKRRAAVPSENATEPVRRAQPKYKVITKDE